MNNFIDMYIFLKPFEVQALKYLLKFPAFIVNMDVAEKGAKCRAEESALLAEWLELVRAKNRIVRRENQLMHMLSQKELEEIQEGITSKLRILMTKPGTQWSQSLLNLQHYFL